MQTATDIQPAPALGAAGAHRGNVGPVALVRLAKRLPGPGVRRPLLCDGSARQWIDVLSDERGGPVLSIVVGSLHGVPVVVRNADVLHDAASTMKLAVLAALYRSGVDLDAVRPVVNRFASVAGGSFANAREWDSDPEPWRLLDGGGSASLRWLAARMITHSSNLATNICLAAVGPDAVSEVWRRAGATHSASPRGIEDYAARDAGVHNRVTAGDLVRLLQSLEPGLLALLERNTWRVDLAAGLPAGTGIAFKNGWFPGVRHSAGVVRPDGLPPYVIAVCYTGPLASGMEEYEDDPAARLIARISAGVWSRRRELAG